MTRLLALAACVLLWCSACGSSDALATSPSEGNRTPMAELVVEIHIPLTPAPGLAENEYRYPWIMEVEDRVAGLTLASDGAEDFDSGEELGDTYAFFLTGPERAPVLSAAKRIATGPGVPAGAFVIVNDSEGDMGAGERVELSEIP